ncbi:MAG: hypothetical protein K6T17_06535 [Fimbriimonadales bacterium]|nr:hypothetical protein [Fimbriimonadales bacterium]
MLCFILTLSFIPSLAIPAGEGFLMPTEYRTIARFQLALNDQEEYQLLKQLAERQAKIHPPTPSTSCT